MIERIGVRRATWALGVARAAFAAPLLTVPGRAAHGWLGTDRPWSRRLAMALAVRDLVLAAGLTSTGRPRRRWLLAAAIADTVDVVVSLAVAVRFGRWRPVPIAILAGASAAGTVVLANAER